MQRIAVLILLCFLACGVRAQVPADSLRQVSDSLQAAACSENSRSEDSLASVALPLIKGEIPAIRYYGTDWNTVNTRSTYCFDQTRTYVLPLDSAHFHAPASGGKVISPYGPRSGRMHTGTDYKQNYGDPIYAAWDGVVRMAKMGYYGYGGIVVVRHENGVETFYAHLSKICVRVNQKVKAGDVIGKAGRTGRATTEHLHFETRFLYQSFNPELIVDFAQGRLRTDTLIVRNGKFYNSETIRHHSLGVPITEDTAQFVPDSALAATLSDTVSVPKSNPVKPKPVAAAPAKKQVYHTVRQGDTLYAIARKYHTSVAKLCSINHIDENGILSLGQKIKLP